MFNVLSIFPLLVLLLWLGLIVYLLVLASRLVTAVEQIAAILSTRLPQPPRE